MRLKKTKKKTEVMRWAQTHRSPASCNKVKTAEMTKTDVHVDDISVNDRDEHFEGLMSPGFTTNIVQKEQ